MYILAYCLVAVIAKNENSVLYSIWEIVNRKSKLAQRAKHTIRSNASQLALCYLHLLALM